MGRRGRGRDKDEAFEGHDFSRTRGQKVEMHARVLGAQKVPCQPLGPSNVKRHFGWKSKLPKLLFRYLDFIIIVKIPMIAIFDFQITSSVNATKFA